MRTYPLHQNLLNVGFGLLLSAIFATPLLADFPKPIAPPKSEVLTPISPTPSTVNTPSAGSSKAVNSAHRQVPVLIEQMLGGKLTPQQAWDEKLLSVDDLLWIFTSYIDPWGSFNWKFNVEVRRGLVALLAQHGADKLQHLEKVSPTVRLWLADYYMSIGDERTVAVSESILKEIKTPMKNDDSLAFQAIEWIGRYHAGKSEYEKGVQSWLRIKNYYQDRSRFIPDALIEAARLAHAMGDDNKAIELYNAVADYGVDFYSTAALLESASLLPAKGLNEMRALLSRRAASGVPSQQGVVALYLLGLSYYRTETWSDASKHLKLALAQAELLSTSRQRILVGGPVSSKAENLLALTVQWKKNPIVCEPSEILVMIGPEKKPLAVTRTIFVRTHHAIPITVESTSPQITIHTEESPWAADTQNLSFEQQITLELSPEALTDGYRASIFIKTPLYKGVSLEVPIIISREVKETQE